MFEREFDGYNIPREKDVGSCFKGAFKPPFLYRGMNKIDVELYMDGQGKRDLRRCFRDRKKTGGAKFCVT